MIGERLGHWVIESELGRGGMGRVYLAHEDPPSSTEGVRKAAVKILAPELAQEAGFLERFQREIEILKEMSHPNIVGLYDAGKHEQHHYYAMEYVDGRNYEDILHEEVGGRMSLVQVAAKRFDATFQWPNQRTETVGMVELIPR